MLRSASHTGARSLAPRSIAAGDLKNVWSGRIVAVNTLEPTRAILRRSLHREVVERLRELILAGELEPRSRVNEAALCERFGISRTPLREAIKLLAAEGLLELLPNRGARVAALSAVEIEELLQVIGALEGAGAELAAERITPEELAAIEAVHEAMVEAWNERDYARYFARNHEIHDAIMAASRCSALQGVYQNLAVRVQRARYSARKTDEHWARAIDDHALMLILLRRRDAAEFGRLMREHVKSQMAVISAAYSAPETPGRQSGRRRATGTGLNARGI
jgi:DNA-binding GntR family transcriptional regulator